MIKLGIVGTGSESHRHFEEFNQIKDVYISAACDVDEKKLKKFSTE